MKKIVTFVLLITATFVAAQTLPDKAEAFRPKVLLGTSLRKSDAEKLMNSGTYGQNDAPTKKIPWVVWSDRDHNVTYTTSNGSQKCTELSMNDELRIAKIANGRALVYEEPKEDLNYPHISEEARRRCKGWVPMSNLLLWVNSLSDDHGITYKAILCVNLNNQQSKVGYGYKNPTQQADFKLSSEFHFYYVMKYVGDKALMATQPTMNGYSHRNLYAWVSSNNYTAWNQRVCMEPTWDKESIRKFSRKGVKAYVSEDKSMTGHEFSYTFEVKPSDPNPDEDDEYYRWPGKWLRFPILSSSSNPAQYKCTAFKGNVTAFDIHPQGDDPRDRLLPNLSTINVVVLLDATKSMNVYSSAVSQAIKDGCDFFGRDEYKMKVAAVLYRDYKDGDYLTETYNFTDPTNEGLHGFIQAGGQYGYKSDPADKTQSEALYFGMNKALNMFKDPEQSNLLIVIGDCGNDLNDKRISQSSLISLARSKRVNIVSYQVHNRDASAYASFNNQLLEIEKASLRGRCDDVMKSARLLPKSYPDGSGTYYQVSPDPDNLFTLTIHRYPAKTNADLSSNYLKQLLTHALGRYAAKVKGLIDRGSEIIWNPNITPTGGDISVELIKKRLGTTNVKALLGVTGFTTIQSDGDNLWHAEVYLTHTELGELVSALEPLYRVAFSPNSDNRKPFADAMRALVSHIAPGENLNSSDVAAIMGRVYGIPVQTAFFKCKLSDVLDKQVTKPDVYRRMLSEFKSRYERLRRIHNGNTYKYKYSDNAQTYYWIPIEYLP